MGLDELSGFSEVGIVVEHRQGEFHHDALTMAPTKMLLHIDHQVSCFALSQFHSYGTFGRQLFGVLKR